MNKPLFDSMREQMSPSPQARAALAERLAQAPERRFVPWRRYGALAACGALVLCTCWGVQSRSEAAQLPQHSYVLSEASSLHLVESTAVSDQGNGGESAPNTGDLPIIHDVAVQEGAAAYEKLMARFQGQYPDWYGGAFINGSGTLTVLLVSGADPGDKSLELQVLNWTGGDSVCFSSAKYPLARLSGLVEQLDRLAKTDPACGEVMAGWGVDERENRVELTLTEASSHVLAALAGLDPEDDAIYVQVGPFRYSVFVEESEAPAVHHVMPGGSTPPEDEDLIADEPLYDGAHYDLEPLPEELPEQKRPALEVQSDPEEGQADTSSFAP